MLKDQINNDFKAAFKEKREAEVSVLKMLKASLLNKEKEKQYQVAKGEQASLDAVLTDEEIVDVVVAETKKLRDSLALFEQGGRQDLVDGAKKEIDILSHYLPEQLSEEEVRKLVSEAITAVGASTIKDMGKVMGRLVPQTKGRADSGLVGKIVKESLTA